MHFLPFFSEIFQACEGRVIVMQHAQDIVNCYLGTSGRRQI